MLNIQRDCEAALNIIHPIRKHKLGIQQSSSDIFTLSTAGFIPTELADNPKKMVIFRNIAVHEYQRLQQSISEMVILNRFGDFSYIV